ncbi:hypothetical protein SARC_13002 [Sphaeroforma arctica JP610]|uniref:Uncharacterized protein n=1 Tax=Sphaeroforma arctica JP610 TaxID=667725 RepID=A0A0L0FD89_9EUKA|nr:hypothetical protein SARC_13002 [Sphaeroforma arctica JP610]KNC74451.1 hypothetical protein SARC_13002 [Sphaeroforma arctica JP610]|eukprot:XP_014148353.1 hypothetical protein SARC_13002 [Sphaeroforma arctica JP610]
MVKQAGAVLTGGEFNNLWLWNEYVDLVRTKVTYTELGESQMAERVRILKQSLSQDFFMTLQSRILPAMRADPDWLVAFVVRLYAEVWPPFSKGDKAAVTAKFARSLMQDPERMFEVLQELIVFMCGHSLLTVLIPEVEAQDEHQDEPVASTAEYMADMQKHLAAY